MLGRDGTLLGERSAGRHAPLFKTWAAREGNEIDILPGGKVRYTTRITDPDSRFAGQSVSVDYTEGVPDFSRYSVARLERFSLRWNHLIESKVLSNQYLEPFSGVQHGSM